MTNYPRYYKACFAVLAAAIILIIPQIVSAQPWLELDKVSASDKASSDLLGASGRVDISGNFAIAGVPFKQLDSEENAGRVYIFEFDSIMGEWVQAELILAADRKPQDAFGVSVAISGSYAVIGANGVNDDANGENELESAGAAYIYQMGGNGNWNFQQKIVPSERKEFDRFGMGVEIDGQTIVVGAIGNDKDEEGNDFKSGAGAAFIFTLDDTDTWIEVSKIVASNRGPSDQFGFPIAMRDTRIVIGAPRKKHEGVEGAGNVYIFDVDTSGTWAETQVLKSPQASENAQFGISVGIYGDYAIIGEHKSDLDTSGENELTDTGLAHLYRADTNQVWSLTQTLEASDRSEKDLFGSSVAISDDYLFVSAVQQNTDADNDNSLNDAGAVYVFKSDDAGVWSQIQKTVATDRADFAGFGSEVNVDGDFVAIGSSRAAADGVLFAGALYIFEQCNTASAFESTACDSYLSPAGNLLISSGIYTEVIPNMNGCDSVITIDLTILNSTTTTETVLACDSFTVPSGDTTFFETTSYVDTITNAVGCDSIIAFDIIIVSVDTSVTVTGDSLIANAIPALYQWIDCESGIDIAGATDKTYVAAVSGVYRVSITDFTGCTGLSACYAVTSTGTKDISAFPGKVVIFPNPTSGTFTIDLGEEYNAFHVSIKNIDGRVIKTLKGDYAQYIYIDISEYVNGVYFIETRSGEYLKTIRIVKH